MPPALVNSIKKDLPDYRIPAGADLAGRWTERGETGVPQFFCRGDFSGDGRTDFALILIGQNAWRFVIFEQTREGDFFPVYVARPKLRTELPKVGEDTSIETPQEVIVKTIQKGQVWAPEGGDQPYEVKLRTDGIIVEHLKKLRFADLDETTLIEYKDGQYKQSNVLELLVPDEKAMTKLSSGTSRRQPRSNRQVPISAVPRQVGPGTHMDGLRTDQAFEASCV